MREHIAAQLRASARWHDWAAEHLSEPLAEAAHLVSETLRNGGKVLFCGNGGSAADSQHLAAELVGRYRLERRALPAIALTTDTSILTAVSNDYAFEEVFARQVEALARPGDVLVLLTTSGRSRNLLRAAEAARGLGVKTIAFSGRDGGPLAGLTDLALTVPAETSDRVQECHIALGHILCELVEQELASMAENAGPLPRHRPEKEHHGTP